MKFSHGTTAQYFIFCKCCDPMTRNWITVGCDFHWIGSKKRYLNETQVILSETYADDIWYATSHSDYLSYKYL